MPICPPPPAITPALEKMTSRMRWIGLENRQRKRFTQQIVQTIWIGHFFVCLAESGGESMGFRTGGSDD